eukprot:TRINITY_DN11032_c0_g1_i1.p1 TRINITY_DN11032_c0_g1~~TRINITY_DN11032_c0_g1_i1.p1  ORF type:complete len:368 (-),score=119.60 TRINITY_DN11032_c0_g1_i1:131-1234(-)
MVTRIAVCHAGVLILGLVFCSPAALAASLVSQPSVAAPDGGNHFLQREANPRSSTVSVLGNLNETHAPAAAATAAAQKPEESADDWYEEEKRKISENCAAKKRELDTLREKQAKEGVKAAQDEYEHQRKVLEEQEQRYDEEQKQLARGKTVVDKEREHVEEARASREEAEKAVKRGEDTVNRIKASIEKDSQCDEDLKALEAALAKLKAEAKASAAGPVKGQSMEAWTASQTQNIETTCKTKKQILDKRRCLRERLTLEGALREAKGNLDSAKRAMETSDDEVDRQKSHVDAVQRQLASDAQDQKIAADALPKQEMKVENARAQLDAAKDQLAEVRAGEKAVKSGASVPFGAFGFLAAFALHVAAGA